MGTPLRPHFAVDRRTIIGASEVAAALQLSPYQSPLELYRVKKGLADPFVDTAETILGHVLEPMLFQHACDIYGLNTSDFSDFEAQKFFQKEYVGCHLDYYSPQLNIECKTTTAWLESAWGKTEMRGDVPPAHLVQVQVQMHLSATPKTLIPVMFFKDGIRQGLFASLDALDNAGIKQVLDNLLAAELAWIRFYEVEYDPSIGTAIWQKANAWYINHIINDIPPEPVNLDDCRILYARHSGVIDALPEHTVLFDQYRELSAQISDHEKKARQLKKERDQLRVQIEKLMGNKSELWCSELNGKFVRKTVNVKPKDGFSYTKLVWKGAKNG